MPCRRPLLLESCEERILCDASLLISTDGNASIPAGNGITSWSDSAVVEMADPNLQLEPGTSRGTFSTWGDLDAAAADGNADVNGLHVVGRTVTIGTTNPVTLQAGDILFTTQSN